MMIQHDIFTPFPNKKYPYGRALSGRFKNVSRKVIIDDTLYHSNEAAHENAKDTADNFLSRYMHPVKTP
jgi:hypothetical protein